MDNNKNSISIFMSIEHLSFGIVMQINNKSFGGNVLNKCFVLRELGSNTRYVSASFLIYTVLQAVYGVRDKT